MSEVRKIAAIMVADVVGYSRLAGADEDRILARMRALRSDLIDPTISVNRGRVVKRTGDGALVEFRSVVDAVRCAIEVQNGMIERNAGVAPERRIEFRIGVHLGDVVEESDGDLMGDGVNVAARLEGIADPNGICLSSAAYEQVRDKLKEVFVDLGEKELKNIARPVRAYRVAMDPTAAKSEPAPKKRLTLAPFAAGIAVLFIVIAAGAWHFLGANLGGLVASNAIAPAEAAHLSIVVLPFANLSKDSSQDYFADGVTENLTTDLSRIRNSFVIARNTAFTFKGKNVDARDIGKELGVRYVLEGSVQRDQNRVRVNAQLIDAKSGAHLWAERFEEDLADLFRLQDRVVARLANSLNHRLVKAEADTSARAKNPDAIDLTMHGLALLWQAAETPTKDTLDAARTLFDQALKIDPNYDDALAGDATASVLAYALGWTNPETDYDAKIFGQTDRAIALAPDNVRAYFAKSLYLTISRRAKEGLGIADAGLAIDPNFAELYATRGAAEAVLGRSEQAKADLQQAMRLSPRDPGIGLWHTQLGLVEHARGQFDAAIDEYHKSIDMGFRVYIPYAGLAAIYALDGQMEEAQSALVEVRRLDPKLTIKSLNDGMLKIPSLVEGLRKAGLPEE